MEVIAERNDQLYLDDLKVPLLIYDDHCPLCLRFKQSLERIPSTQDLNKVSLHNKDLFMKFPFLEKEACEKELHLIVNKDTILRGEEVIEYLIKLSPIVKKFSWLIESKVGQKSIDFFYQSSKKYRQSLLNSCSKCKNKSS